MLRLKVPGSLLCPPAIALAPPPVSLTSFTYFFTTAWAYTAGVTLALSELDSPPFPPWMNTMTRGPVPIVA